MQYHFILNKIVHQAEATISVFDLGLLRGYGAFDFFKVHAGVPVFMDDHIDRFFNSARLLHLTIAYSRTELKKMKWSMAPLKWCSPEVYLQMDLQWMAIPA